MSGLLKLLHPARRLTRRRSCASTWSSRWRARRRVKEQLKKRGSFEFYKTSFSYIDSRTTARSAPSACPSRAAQGAISQDPLPPGTVYTAAVDDEGEGGPLPARGDADAGHRQAAHAGRPREGPQGVAEPRVQLPQSVKDKLGLTPAPGAEGHLRRGRRPDRRPSRSAPAAWPSLSP